MRAAIATAIAVTAAAAPARAQREGRQGCDPYVGGNDSGSTGFDVSLASGWLDSANPVDGLGWAAAIELRRRIGQRFGLGGRIAWIRGPDEGIDASGDGSDDDETGSFSAFALTAAAHWVAWKARGTRDPIFVDLTGGGGFLLDIGDTAEDDGGPVAEAGVGLRWFPIRLGVRGMTGAGDYRALLAELTLGGGGLPATRYGAGCSGMGPSRGPAFAFGIDLIASGVGLPGGLSYLSPGVGVEVASPVGARVDAVGRVDLFSFPRFDDDAATVQSALAGVRYRTGPGGWFSHVMGGYSRVTDGGSGDFDSGAVVEAGVGYDIAPTAKEAAYARVHLRFGVLPENRDLRAVFVSVGGEVRNARDKWR